MIVNMNFIYVKNSDKLLYFVDQWISCIEYSIVMEVLPLAMVQIGLPLLGTILEFLS